MDTTTPTIDIMPDLDPTRFDASQYLVDLKIDEEKHEGILTLSNGKTYRACLHGVDEASLAEMDLEAWRRVALASITIFAKKGMLTPDSDNKSFKGGKINEQGVTPLSEKNITHEEGEDTREDWAKLQGLFTGATTPQLPAPEPTPALPAPAPATPPTTDDKAPADIPIGAADTTDPTTPPPAADPVGDRIVRETIRSIVTDIQMRIPDLLNAKEERSLQRTATALLGDEEALLAIAKEIRETHVGTVADGKISERLDKDAPIEVIVEALKVNLAREIVIKQNSRVEDYLTREIKTGMDDEEQRELIRETVARFRIRTGNEQHDQGINSVLAEDFLTQVIQKRLEQLAADAADTPKKGWISWLATPITMPVNSVINRAKALSPF